MKYCFSYYLFLLRVKFLSLSYFIFIQAMYVFIAISVPFNVLFCLLANILLFSQNSLVIIILFSFSASSCNLLFNDLVQLLHSYFLSGLEVSFFIIKYFIPDKLLFYTVSVQVSFHMSVMCCHDFIDIYNLFHFYFAGLPFYDCAIHSTIQYDSRIYK